MWRWCALALLAVSLAPAGVRATQASAIPARYTDAEFWRIVSEFSEADGYFQSDNLVSNELTFQWVIPRLQAAWTPGQVYVGVGPDQNFTYLAALRPSAAFIVDIRRGNLRVHLLYKALMEVSPTRAAFLSRLLSRPVPPAALAQPDMSAAELFAAFDRVDSDEALFSETVRMVRERLEVQHGFSLTADDRDGIEYVLSSFYYAGASLAYSNTARGRYPSYRDLMTTTDQGGVARSYLANEALYAIVRDMQVRNLVVPVVGDFSGAKALRALGRYLTTQQATVGVIYTSNVEQYLFQYGTWPAYYANVAALPTDTSSTFVRSCFNSCSTNGVSRSAQLLDPVRSLLAEVTAGRVTSYWELLARSR
jgi:hypothetical protein